MVLVVAAGVHDGQSLLSQESTVHTQGIQRRPRKATFNHSLGNNLTSTQCVSVCVFYFFGLVQNQGTNLAPGHYLLS